MKLAQVGSIANKANAADAKSRAADCSVGTRMRTMITTALAVLVLSGCATNPHARAIERLNEQIEEFNREPRAFEKVESRVSHLKYDQVKKQIVCTDRQGMTILTLAEQPDGSFKGQLQSETVAPPNAEGYGHWILSHDVQLEKGEFQQTSAGDVLKAAPEK